MSVSFRKEWILNLLLSFILVACQSGSTTGTGGEEGEDGKELAELTFYSIDEFVMGADLSYVNQILDYEGAYKDSGSVESPYKIFSEYGTNTIRLRLWHNPDWIREEVYEDLEVPLYSGRADVTESIQNQSSRVWL